MKKAYILTDKYYNNRLTTLKELDLIKVNSTDTEKIVLNPNITYQKVKGFGGSFTESAVYNLTRVNKEMKEEALKAYFDQENGLNYTLGRMSMNSCDFSLYSYNYVKDYDETLESFDISHDLEVIIPTIKEAEKLLGKSIKMMVSPWSPCWWMKDNLSNIHGGHLLPKYYQTWANYYVKYINSIKTNGINVFALSVQNEPAAVQTWDSCIYSATEEANFVKNYLGKTLKDNHLDDLELYIWDHNRDIIIDRVIPSYTDPEASKYIYGTAFHWYDNEPFENLKKHHDLFPDKHLLLSECCIERIPSMHTYESGERYGRNILNNFLNYSEGYIDWNLFLDETGGPNRVNNLCDAPVIINIREGRVIKQVSYYFIGQFSKYIKPNALRIDLKNSNKDIETVAFINPTGEIVLIVLNETEHDVDYEIKIDNENTLIKSLKKSIMTIIMEG